jgi:hypothetical protein
VSTAIQILPRPPGLEFTSLLTFSTGAVLGSILGASLGVVVMLANAFLSPYGLAGINMPFQMLGMGIIGTIGGLYKMDNNGKARFFAETAVLGAFLTFVYYLITNMGFAITVALVSRISIFEAVAVAQVTGAIVTLFYVVSNTVLFGAGAVPLVNAMRKLLGR